ncbi:MAG TPA: preprotein translocase subunit SecG [Thermoanaerobaculia bacterium]|nr:preprotein translocase subunit SecG [Thermoanaerobaculia bacterium]HUM28611.1 preprotein translocase subunit SecG [Thermoanaerobaculia bacterium]HXK66781.1 preprotein translocase subunit SecG [Thermoanaerobaculia bacterium]
MFTVFLVIIHVIVCLFLIGVVLLQQGKGSDLASAFGGGGGQAAFGARSGATFMHKLTVGAFVVFILTSVMLVIVNRQEGPSVVDEVKQTAVEEETQGATESQEAAETQTPDTGAASEAPAEDAQPQN